MRARLLLAIAACATSAAAWGAEKEEAPTGIARFTRHDRVVEVKISPGGHYLAAISQEEGKRTLFFIDLKARKFLTQLKPDGENMPGRFFWVNDERVVVEMLAFEGYLDTPLTRGELFAVDATGKNGKLVFGYRAGEKQVGSHLRKAERAREWAWIVDPLKNDARNVLIATTRWGEVDPVATIFELDVLTGLRKMVARAPLADAEVLTDEKGEVRLASGTDENLRWHHFLREGGEWREMTGSSSLAPGGYPVGVASGVLYAVEPDGKGFAVVGIRLDGGGREVLARSDWVEPSGLVVDHASGRVVAVAWDPDVPVVDVVDEKHPASRVLRGIEAAYPGEAVRVASRTQDDGKMVVRVYSDRDPGRFLLVDSETMTAEPLFETRPWISPAEMAETSAFHVRASDGQWIHGYLTLPPGERAGPPPLVVLPHGGPHGARDRWGFDPEVQLLAGEGFAVLRVNYRGSGGYGAEFERAGFRHWGDRVVEDIVDATRWAIKKGLVDAERVCALGASFGAYASLQAAIVAPELFRCAIGYAGLYDLTRMSWAGDLSHTRHGRGWVRTAAGADRKALEAASPAFHADALKARVLLLHGEEDRRTPIEQAERMRDALVAAGRPPEWHWEPREGHGYHDEAARERTWTRIVAFLKESTGAVPAAAPSAPAAR